MARHINEKSVLAQIDAMDEMDGTVYDPSENNEDEEGGDEGDTEDEGKDTDDTKEEDVDALGGTDGSGTSNDEPINKGKDTKPTETKPDPSTFRKQGSNFVDAKNNIVDPQSGAIIAKAGTERRLFEKTQRLGAVLDERTEKLKKYEEDDAKMDNLRGAIKGHGMSTDEFAEGINMVLAFKSDPVGTAKKILEQVLAMGHNVTDILGADAGNAIEMSAVSRMLDERLKPLITPLEQKRVQSEQEKEAEKQWNKFCEINDYAEVHEVILDKMLGDNPGMSPQKAYNELVKFSNKHNLDFSLPLGPQIEQAQSAPKKKDPANQVRTQQKPFPNGGSVKHTPISEGDINPNADWNTILKSAGL